VISGHTPKRVQCCNGRVLSGGNESGNGRQSFGLLFLLTFLLAAFTPSGCAGSGSSSVQQTSEPISHSVTLDWIASPSAVIGYNVYRGTVSGGPYTQLNSSLVTTTRYQDSSVQSGQTYYYVVTAVDSSQVESTNSNQVSATIPTP
jgi:hypothetical protein